MATSLCPLPAQPVGCPGPQSLLWLDPALPRSQITAQGWLWEGKAFLGSTDGFLINTLVSATHFHMSFTFKCCGG